MEREDIQAVSDILAWFLADGPKPYDVVKRHCSNLGITRAELKAARKELNVKTVNTGATWLWEVPDQEDQRDA